MGTSVLHAESISFSGELSSYILLDTEHSGHHFMGGRYLPQLDISLPVNEEGLFDAEFSANVHGTSRLQNFLTEETTQGKIEPYRLWGRWSTSALEIRFGLQKINFGPATLLRSLQWFDTINPKDPLQITGGVYGFLYRHYFLNNATLWGWGLYGNEDLKGSESIPTRKDTIEGGARYQLPVFSGEMGLTIHHRKLDISYLPDEKNSTHENRMGLDGRWDAGIGFWFEGVFVHQDLKGPVYEKHLTMGLDYTFDIGNGVTVTAEHKISAPAQKGMNLNNDINISAMSLNYPLTLFDTLSLLSFYNWDHQREDIKVSLKRSYDTMSFYLSGFYSNDHVTDYETHEADLSFSGKGFQFMVVWNH